MGKYLIWEIFVKLNKKKDAKSCKADIPNSFQRVDLGGGKFKIQE